MLRNAILALLVVLTVSQLFGQDFLAETLVCRTGTFTLESPLTDGQAYVYQWERSFDGGGSWLPVGDNSPQLVIGNPNAGIRYRMAYATDANCLADQNCRSLTSATQLVINIPTFAQGMTICAGDTIFVGATPLTSPGNHETILSTPAGCDSIVATFLQVLPAYEEYFLVDLCPGEGFRGRAITRDTMLTDTFTAASGCDSTVTFEVNLAFGNTAPITGATRLCRGASTELTAPGGFTTYAWSDGSTGERITANMTGSYGVTITDFTGCSLELEHELIITDLTVEAVNTTAPICPQTATGTLEVLASGDLDLLYSIDGGESFQLDPVFTDLSADDYSLVVENADGCQVTQVFTLQDAPSLNLMTPLPEEQTIERGDSVPLLIEADFPVETYRWSGANFLSCTDCAEPVAFPPADATFTVEAIAAGGCSASQSFRFVVKDSRRMYIPTAFSPNADDQNDRWRIYAGPRATAISGLQIADRWGGIRFQQTTATLPPEEAGWDGRDLNGQELDAGTYLFTATVRYADGSTKAIGGTINLMR